MIELKGYRWAVVDARALLIAVLVYKKSGEGGCLLLLKCTCYQMTVDMF